MRTAPKPRYGVIAVILLALATTACSSTAVSLAPKATPQATACAPIALAGPNVIVDAPENGSTNEPTSGGTIVYAVGGSPVPIVLFTGSPNSEPATSQGIATLPTALPSPLPSPFATPPYPGFSYYAVSYPKLLASTTYSIAAIKTESDYCSDTLQSSSSSYVIDASFTTE